MHTEEQNHLLHIKTPDGSWRKRLSVPDMWIHEINPTDLGNFPSGLSGQVSFVVPQLCTKLRATESHSHDLYQPPRGDLWSSAPVGRFSPDRGCCVRWPAAPRSGSSACPCGRPSPAWRNSKQDAVNSCRSAKWSSGEASLFCCEEQRA